MRLRYVMVQAARAAGASLREEVKEKSARLSRLEDELRAQKQVAAGI